MDHDEIPRNALLGIMTDHHPIELHRDTFLKRWQSTTVMHLLRRLKLR
jgi:hypothetical protein